MRLSAAERAAPGAHARRSGGVRVADLVRGAGGLVLAAVVVACGDAPAVCADMCEEITDRVALVDDARCADVCGDRVAKGCSHDAE